MPERREPVNPSEHGRTPNGRELLVRDREGKTKTKLGLGVQRQCKPRAKLDPDGEGPLRSALRKLMFLILCR